MFRILVFCTIIFFTLSDNCPFDEYCVACNGSYCERCINAYPDANGECIPDSSVANCSIYRAKGQCEECRLGYFLTSNSCKKITLAHCAIYDAANDSCQACFDSYLVENGKCNTNNHCHQDNCEICNSTNCLHCRRGFTVDSQASCVEEPTAGCHSMSAESAQCLMCREDNYMHNHECRSTGHRRYAAYCSGIIVLSLMVLII